MQKKAIEEWATALLILSLIVAALVIYFLHERNPSVIYGPALPESKPAVATSTEAHKKHFDTVLPAIHPNISKGIAEVISSSPDVFAYAHGTIEADGRFFIGMTNKSGNRYPPNQLTVFADEAYLNRPSLLSLPDWGDIQTMVYDKHNDMVYFELSNNNALKLYSIDPHSYSISTILSTTTIDAGMKPAIATDGTYIYGITNTDPSTVFKVRISDGELTSSRIGHIPNGHSAAIGKRGDSVELYFGGGMTNGFEKVDAETLKSISSIRIDPCSMSDDTPFVDDGAYGGYVYIGCEIVPYGLRINTADMSVQRFSLPGASLGLFSFGRDIYNAAQDGYIDVFPGGDLGNLNRYRVVSEKSPIDTKGQDLEVNELLYSPVTRHMYFTAWYGVPGLYEVATSTE
jgi:hypothetical protein